MEAPARHGNNGSLGGHGVPEETVRRRYHAGLRNFFHLYQPLATTWAMYDNSETAAMRLIAAGSGGAVTDVGDAAVWQKVQETYCHGQ